MLELKKTAQERDDNARIFFEKMTPENRKAWMESYQTNILRETDPNYKPKMPRMPWMLPSYRRGHDILKSVMGMNGEC